MNKYIYLVVWSGMHEAPEYYVYFHQYQAYYQAKLIWECSAFKDEEFVEIITLNSYEEVIERIHITDLLKDNDEIKLVED